MEIPEKLRQLTLPFQGRMRAATLRVPTAGEILPLVIEPDIRSPSLVAASLTQEVLALIDTLDGECPTEDDALALSQDAEALGRVLQVRNALYEHLVAAGRALARCPNCGADAEVDLQFYWLALRLPRWNFFDRGVLMHVPSLSNPLPSGRRPEPARLATSIAFRHPSDPVVEGVLRTLQSDESRRREAEAWAAWVPPGIEKTEGHWHWRKRVPGFRAMLRLAVALDPSPDRPSLSPSTIEAMPIGAYLFLDLLHFATSNVDITDGTRAEVTCPACLQRFLPMLGFWHPA
jgi:hypothetical protein